MTKSDLPLFKRMTELFQCPGCVGGGNTDCGQYVENGGSHSCLNHVCGTLAGGPGFLVNFALGMPKGFNRPGGWHIDDLREAEAKAQKQHAWKSESVMNLRFFSKDEAPEWNFLNVPVWKLYQEGFTFVRTCLPRTAMIATDVIEGELEVPSPAIDVGPLMDQFD